MQHAYIIGTGGHGRVIQSIIHHKYLSITFIEILYTADYITNQGIFFDYIASLELGDFYIGIGANPIRTKVYNKLKELGITPSNCISDNAFIAHDANIGNGVVICHGAIVGSKAIIGNNTIINTLSSVDHDCKLGNNSQVTAGVILGGTTSIGENCFLGIKSATIPKITIGDNSIIMAGSMVYKDVPKDVMVGGNPARIIKKLII
jgi:sugar O-acyltransferase (sialic acid O-acetyltransferase NeuD family)